MRQKPCCDTCKARSRAYFLMLNSEDLDQLKYDKSCYVFKKGQIIFHEDNRAIGVYCLNQGRIKISKTGFEGREQIVRFVTPGELFGIRSAIGAQTYSVNATAIENSTVCFIPYSKFCELMVKYPAISRSLIIALSNRLLDAENKMTSLAQKPVRERLAESLIFMSKQLCSDAEEKEAISQSDNHTINLSREDLANIVGSATETVIRLLSEFKEDQLIEIKGRKITLLDIAKLEKVANLDF